MLADHCASWSVRRDEGAWTGSARLFDGRCVSVTAPGPTAALDALRDAVSALVRP